MAVDQYGTIKQKYFDTLPQRTQDDYTFLSNTSRKYKKSTIFM